MPPPTRKWSASHKQELTKLWLLGLSAKEIAVRLKRTPSQVTGQARRLKLARKPGHVVSFPKKRYAKKPLTLPREYSPYAVTTLDIKAYQCRWPVSGEGVTTKLCGRRREDLTQPYCERHQKRAHQPHEKRSNRSGPPDEGAEERPPRDAP